MKEKVFKDCDFLKWFEDGSLKKFKCVVPNEMFLTLVRMFDYNFKYVKKINTGKVKRHQIKLTLIETTLREAILNKVLKR